MENSNNTINNNINNNITNNQHNDGSTDESINNSSDSDSISDFAQESFSEEDSSNTESSSNHEVENSSSADSDDESDISRESLDTANTGAIPESDATICIDNSPIHASQDQGSINIPIIECTINDIITTVSSEHSSVDNAQSINNSITSNSSSSNNSDSSNNSNSSNNSSSSNNSLNNISNNLHMTDYNFLRSLIEDNDEQTNIEAHTTGQNTIGQNSGGQNSGGQNTDDQHTIENETDMVADDYINIKPLLIYSQLRDKVTSLTKLLDSIDNDQMYASCKYNIVFKIISIFRTVNVQNYFDKTFLDYNMVDYLIKKKLFYDYVFTTLLLRESYIDYFDFKAHIDHFAFYKNLCKKMTERLHFFLQNSNFYSFRLSDFTVYISFMRIIHNYINTISLHQASELILECRQLFMSVIEQLYIIIKSSRKTLQTIKFISKNYMIKYIDKTGCAHINRLESEINNCNKNINRFINDDSFTALFAESLIRFNISTDLSHPCYNEIISVLPSFTFKWYQPNDTIDNLVTKTYLDNIDEIFKTNSVNIHTKVKFITESNATIFNNPDIIHSLINYYSEIERFSENTGFYEKELTRSHIVFAILEYIYPTEQSVDILTMSGCPKEYQKDEVNERIAIFDTVDQHVMRSFITLLISEVTELFNDINIAIEKLNKTSKKDIMVIYKYISSIKQITIYYKIISILFNHTNSANSFFIEKYSELMHTILLHSLNARIYCELDVFTKSSYGILNIIHSDLANMLSDFYKQFYIDLFHLTTITEYIKHIAQNEQLYDIKCIKDTEKLIGFMHIGDINLSVSDILKEFLTGVDQAIFDKSKTDLKYNQEIPFEFLDPIYYTPIVHPIELPNTKNIVEKNVILNHLVFNQTNPFDGLELTLKELLDYNKLPEVVERVKEFSGNYNKWKFEHVI